MTSSARVRSVAVPASLVLLVAAAIPAVAADWPQWAGPDRNFVVDDPGLATAWPEDGPAVLWERKIGNGYAGVVVGGGRAFTGYRDGVEDVWVALDASTGETVWEFRYDAPVYEEAVLQFGEGPNATPLLIDGRLITVSYTGLVHALDARTGKPLWSIDMRAEHGAENLRFGHSAAPIAHDGKVVLMVGGPKVGAMAVDPKDGGIVWKGAPTTVSYAAPAPIEVGGRTQIAYFGATDVYGVDAATGALEWSHPVRNQYENNCTMALQGPDGTVWAVTQLAGGGRGLKLTRTGGETEVEEAWVNDRVKIHYWGAAPVGDMVVASIGGEVTFLSGIDFRTGRILWRERGFSQTQILRAGDKLVILDESGRLTLGRATREGFERLASAEVTDALARTPPALVGTTLYLRDMEHVRALDLGPGEKTGKKASND